ncbi:MAG: hypothetical protein AB7D02_01135 [Candidatus Paceibacterota bacterium]
MAIKRKIKLSSTEKDFLWYFFFFTIIGGLFLLALYLKNILFAFILIIFSLIYYFQDQKEKEEKFFKAEINSSEVKINKEVFSLKKDFISFEIFENKKSKNFPLVLRLDFKNRWRSSVFIPLKKSEKEIAEKILKDNGLIFYKRSGENILEDIKKALKI